MKRLYIIVFFCSLATLSLFSVESIIMGENCNVFRYHFSNSNRMRFFGTTSISFFSDESDGKKIKSPIFENIDLSYFQEKDRGFKLIVAIGVVSFSIGSALLLAGLINYFVNFNAVSINGNPIEVSYNTYYALMGVGGGLMAVGLPLLLVGSIKLGMKGKKQKKTDDSTGK